MDDLYSILGVSEDATQDEISAEYKKLAIKFHPDASSEEGASEKFKQISTAYETLGDPAKRRQYDMRGQGGFNININDFFGRVRKAANSQAKIEVSLEEAKTGCTKILKIKRPMKCVLCSGTGASKTEKCGNCRGSGVVNMSVDGPFNVQSACNVCGGRGMKILESCNDCNNGMVSGESEEVRVEIPAGIMSGMALRFPGKGSEGVEDQMPGDLIVHINVKKHDVFDVKGVNLIYRTPISYAKLVMGCKLDVPTLDGEVMEVTIPPGTLSGSNFKLRGLGMPDLNYDGSGDLYAVIDVEIPKDLSEEHLKIIEQLVEIENEKNKQ